MTFFEKEKKVEEDNLSSVNLTPAAFWKKVGETDEAMKKIAFSFQQKKICPRVFLTMINYAKKKGREI